MFACENLNKIGPGVKFSVAPPLFVHPVVHPPPSGVHGNQIFDFGTHPLLPLEFRYPSLNFLSIISIVIQVTCNCQRL